MFRSKKIKTLLIALSVFLLFPIYASAASYTVVNGDTLYDIGEVFNTSAAAIMEDNNLSSSTIYPGQVLYVPAETYTVKSGDTLYLIAKAHGVSLYALRKVNGKWDNMIYPGQKLVLPGKISSSNTSAGSTSGSVISYTSSERDLLARLITAEADGQPYNAEVAVGAVVVNRVKSSQFPNSISGVIYQVIDGLYQFTPVENGWIDRTATQEALEAADDALRGVDPSNGALFYFDDSATNKWLWSKPLAARIGRMVYVY